MSPAIDTPSAREAFERALASMQAAHAALAADVNDGTLAVYSAACASARRAFDAMVDVGFQGARRSHVRR